MTGNVSLFAEHLALGQVVLALSFGGLLVAFLLGAWLAALAIQIGLRRGWRTIYALAILGEGAIVLAVGLVLLWWPKQAGETHLVIVLSFVMGLQNAVSTVISSARVRTTHVSGIATDLAVELAALSDGAAARQAAMPALRLHAATLAAFAAGGIFGALGFALGGYRLLVALGLGLGLIALPDLLRAGRG
jgi:uncharacterized membrane protein YoaK (UPF0700 family)